MMSLEDDLKSDEVGENDVLLYVHSCPVLVMSEQWESPQTCEVELCFPC